jgi:hypothetical protein
MQHYFARLTDSDTKSRNLKAHDAHRDVCSPENERLRGLVSCSGVASGTALLGGGDQMNLTPQMYWLRPTLPPASLTNIKNLSSVKFASACCKLQCKTHTTDA